MLQKQLCATWVAWSSTLDHEEAKHPHENNHIPSGWQPQANEVSLGLGRSAIAVRRSALLCANL